MPIRSAADGFRAGAGGAQQPEGCAIGAMPALPRAVVPLPVIAGTVQKALLSSVASLPETLTAPWTRLNDIPKSLPGTVRLPDPTSQLDVLTTASELPGSIAAPARASASSPAFAHNFER